jgi:hypothetical protein
VALLVKSARFKTPDFFARGSYDAIQTEVWAYSQATSKGATKETRERAERANVVRGSARATVVAEEDVHTSPRAAMQRKRAAKSRQLSESRLG